MEPIISPAFIYLLSIIDGIKGLLFVTSLVCTGVCSALILIRLVEEKAIYKFTKTGFIIGIISLILLIFVPDRDTLIAMYTAKYITVNNIKSGKEIVIDTIKEVVDAINKEER